MAYETCLEEDWKLFRKKVPQWQENYMERLLGGIPGDHQPGAAALRAILDAVSENAGGFYESRRAD